MACGALYRSRRERVETDAAGNVMGVLPATNLPPESTGPVVLLSAHLDTVFPADTPDPALADDRLEVPGACDNAAGVVGMLAVVHALLRAGVELPAPLVVLGNVGEEGEEICAECGTFMNTAHSPDAWLRILCGWWPHFAPGTRYYDMLRQKVGSFTPRTALQTLAALKT